MIIPLYISSLKTFLQKLKNCIINHCDKVMKYFKFKFIFFDNLKISTTYVANA